MKGRKSVSPLWHSLKLFAAITCVTAHNLLKASPFGAAPLALGITAEEETRSVNKSLIDSMEAINKRLGKIDEIEKSGAKTAEDLKAISELIAEVQKGSLELRKQLLETRSARVRRGGEVSDECAKYLGAIGLIAALRTPGDAVSPAQRAMAELNIKNIMGIEFKTALSSSDIPLPTQYSGEVVELVYEYGQARKYGTVFPLGAGTVKLPKLGTDPVFGLVAGSSGGAEKSPTVVFVTFAAEKFGGLIRLPSEIDEDSIVAMGQFIARYAARQMASIEDTNFFASTGAASGVNGTAEGLTKAVVTDSCFYYQGGTSTSAKTKPSDAVLADFRALRQQVSGVVLGRAKYFMHPTYEALLVSFNTSATVTPYIRGSGGAPATLDGFEIVWVPVLPAYTTSATVSAIHVLFGDASYMYFGTRNGMRFDTSREAAFATDEILIRALERFTLGYMASKAVAGLRCDAS